MSFLQEKNSRRYFMSLACLAAAFLFLALFLSWLHGREMQSLLYEKERTIASSLLEQGVPSAEVAAALSHTVSSEKGAALLEQIGHTTSVSFWLFPAIKQSVFSFGKTALGIMGAFVFVLLGSCLWFFTARESLYQKAAGIIERFSAGDFEQHLPQNEDGTLFLLFAGIEELAVALQAQKEKEQHGKEFLKNMISDISHQLKTPLAALKMYTEIISEEPNQAETVRKFSEKSMQSLERMENLIQALLKMARLDAGSIVFQKSSYPVAELVSRAMESLTARAKEEGKQILTKGDMAATLNCDLQWTSEAVGNLIKNALDHTECGGIIRIEWNRSPAMFRLTVSDNGCGIAQEDIPHIFKRFYRSKKPGGLEDANTRKGVGLGLSLAKSIVEGQGGTLCVESSLGEGSVFLLSFLTDS